MVDEIPEGQVLGAARIADQTRLLDRLVKRWIDSAIEAAGSGVDIRDIMQAHLNTYVNLIAIYDVDVAHAQRIFRDLADRLPDTIGTIRLSGTDHEGSA